MNTNQREVISKKLPDIDLLIILLLFGITLVDTINGVLVTNDLFSISKPYKFMILILMLLKSTFRINNFSMVTFFAFLSFFVGYFGYYIAEKDVILFSNNFIESMKYFIWPISFIYFRSLYIEHGQKAPKLVFQIVNISYTVLLINIGLGLIGLGYQFYPRYDTGVKGFFYSGNEFSLLFIILTALLAWKMQVANFRKYLLFMAFSLFLAFSIGSKASILGVLGIFLIFFISNLKVDYSKINLQKVALIFGGILLFPVIIWFFIRTNKVYFDNFIIKRIEIYDFDMVTWFLSKRNLVAQEGWLIFEKLPEFSKLFGEGEATFQTKFRIIELDFVDLLFNHGYIGLVAYLIIVFYILAVMLKKYKQTPFYKAITLLYLMIILFLANLSGHIINTGIPGFFIGMLFSMIFMPKEILKKNNLL